MNTQSLITGCLQVAIVCVCESVCRHMQAPMSTSLHVPDLVRQEGMVCTSVLCTYVDIL